jgi:hypothetical protein
MRYSQGISTRPVTSTTTTAGRQSHILLGAPMLKSFFTALVLLALFASSSSKSNAQTVIAYWNSGSPVLAVPVPTLITAFEQDYGDTTNIASVTLLVQDQLMYVVGQGTKNGEGRLKAYELVRGAGSDSTNMYVRAATAGTWHSCKGVCCSWCELRVVSSGGTSQVQGCKCNSLGEDCSSGHCDHSTGSGTTGYIGAWY